MPDETTGRERAPKHHMRPPGESTSRPRLRWLARQAARGIKQRDRKGVIRWVSAES